VLRIPLESVCIFIGTTFIVLAFFTHLNAPKEIDEELVLLDLLRRGMNQYFFLVVIFTS